MSRTHEARPEARPAGTADGRKRRDQTQCPKCGHWGCPADRGSYATVSGVVRYRRCSECLHIFKTLRPHDSRKPERVVL